MHTLKIARLKVDILIINIFLLDEDDYDNNDSGLVRRRTQKRALIEDDESFHDEDGDLSVSSYTSSSEKAKPAKKKPKIVANIQSNSTNKKKPSSNTAINETPQNKRIPNNQLSASTALSDTNLKKTTSRVSDINN